jgi:hypothetical protein
MRERERESQRERVKERERERGPELAALAVSREGNNLFLVIGVNYLWSLFAPILPFSKAASGHHLSV